MKTKKKKSIFESRAFRESMKFVYGFGGAIVILGAMFKITHWPGATEMLVAGLTTEALIFIISSFEPLQEESEGNHEHSVSHGSANGVEQFDRMLAEAKIDPALLQSLAAGMKAIASQSEMIGNMTSISQSAQKFTQDLDKASISISQITQASGQITQSFEKANQINFSDLHQNIQALEGNINQVNGVYDKQVKKINSGIEISDKTQNSLAEVLDSLKLVAKNATLYKENIEKLTQNIEKINAVYEGVLAEVESELPEKRKGVFERLFSLFVSK